MDTTFKERFLSLWKKYFNEAEQPITFYYTNVEGRAEQARPGAVPRCIIGALARIRRGQSLAFDAESVGCPGGKKYLGFRDTLMPNFEYFLSCGIPGKMEGERYKKSPELVKETMKSWPAFKAPGRFIVFKRWDQLEKADRPEVVIFFAPPDVLSGLFTLASYDESGQNMISAPFGSGCSTIVQYPYLELNVPNPRSVIGMFDVSARPFVPKNTLTFAAPINKFTRMVDNMEESFLITESWAKVQKRIK
ncbi:MAG: hypothetical protein A2Z29_01285 [Chloroflexi bacterium RBG_16_56_11]|nr:MAG: hypothetical protein A2Z29_01285 [Chloroflexi bacterium RBG_16_56_11]